MKIDRRAFMAAVLAPFAAMSNVGQNLLKFRQEGGVTDLTEKMRLHPLRASRFTDAQHIMLKCRQIGNTETTHALLEWEKHLDVRG